MLPSKKSPIHLVNGSSDSTSPIPDIGLDNSAVAPTSLGHWDAVVTRVVSAPDSIQPWLTAHSIYVYGQEKWHAPLVRPLITHPGAGVGGDVTSDCAASELPEQTTVLELHRSDGRGILRLLFDPDRVTVSGCASDNPRVNDARQSYRRTLLETSSKNAGRSDMPVSRATIGEGVLADPGTTERLLGIVKEWANGDDGDDGTTLDGVTIKEPRAMTSHAECDHEATRVARAACRRDRKRSMAS